MEIITKKEGDKLATIGEQLKEGRLEKKLTIEELQQETKIQKKYLEAIEEDNFSAMPSSYYVRAFIRQYARAVDLDGDRLVKIYDGEPLRTKKVETEVSGTRKAKYREESPVEKIQNRMPLIILSVIALAIIGIVLYATFKYQNNKPLIDNTTEIEIEVESFGTSKSEEIASSTTESSVTHSTTSVSEEKQQKMSIHYEGANGSDINMAISHAKKPLQFTFTGQDSACWLGILINNDYVFQNTIQPYESRSYTLPDNTESVSLVLGSASNLEIKVNNENLLFNPNKEEMFKRTLHLSITYD